MSGPRIRERVFVVERPSVNASIEVRAATRTEAAIAVARVVGLPVVVVAVVDHAARIQRFTVQRSWNGRAFSFLAVPSE